MAKPASPDAYIASFPEPIRCKLEEMRAIIKAAAPEATEAIGYQMPGFKMKTFLVYYAGHKGHIGFYPTGSGIEAFKDEFGPYKWSKGAVQFPLDAPLPVDLIRRIVKFRIGKDLEKHPTLAKN